MQLRSLKLSLLCALSPVLSVFANEGFTIVHFNDFYDYQPKAQRGGIAKLATVVKKLRAEGKKVIVTHGGDTFSPSLHSSIDDGTHIVDLFDKLQLDALAVGNHEFDKGPRVFKKRVEEAQFPVLIANLSDENGVLQSDRPFQKSMLRQFGDLKVGFVGILDVAESKSNFQEGVHLKDGFSSALQEANALRQQGAQLVILLAHMPAKLAKARYMESGAFDIILGADDHNLDLFHNINGPLYVQSEQDARYLSVVQVDMKEVTSIGKKRFQWDPSISLIDTKFVKEDPEFQTQANALASSLDTALSKPFATFKKPMSSEKQIIRSNESGMGNLITDALRQHTGASIALYNGGGIRANKRYNPGEPISRKTILSELPFGNDCVVLNISGDAIARAFHYCADQMAEKGVWGGFLQVSGIQVTYDLSKPQGQRVVSILINGAPLESSKSYTLATNDFITKGGDGYAMLRGGRHLVSPTERQKAANIVAAIVASNPDMQKDIEDRIIILK